MWRLALVMLGSCSFAFMSPPTSSMRDDCNAGLEAPITDTVIAGAAAASFAISAIAATFDHRWWLTTEHLSPFVIPSAVVNGASAAYGYVSRDHCLARRPRPELARR